MIIFDTETTGLVKPIATPLSAQPQIIEYAAIKLDDETLEETGRLEFLVRPESPLSAEITKITGLTDRDLIGQPKFHSHLRRLQEFHLGEKHLIAHNLAFDTSMLTFDLRRADAIHKFPWPIHHTCTVQATHHIKGYRLNLQKLYTHLFGEGFEDAHRAMADVEALTRCVRELIQTNALRLPV